jgi:hypothetical protein
LTFFPYPYSGYGHWSHFSVAYIRPCGQIVRRQWR